jgi:ribosomal protein S18 acetylase RimI-like enzyme
MTQPFLVRLMRQSDVDEVLGCHGAVLEVCYSRPVIESFLRSHYLTLVLVFVDGGAEAIVGFSVAHREWVSACSTQRTAYLSTFGILPEFQRRGLGAFLFRLTCRVLRAHYGVRDIRLHMLKDKRATYAFYVAQQMAAVRVLREYYSFLGKRHDAVLMRAELAAVPREPARPDVALLPEIAELLATRQRLCPLAQLFCAP